MSSATNRPARTPPIIVRVQHHPRGRWEVLTPGRPGRISCETLEDARRIAYLPVAHGHHCELIIRDAYNRVMEHELIDGHDGAPTNSQSPAPKKEALPFSNRTRLPCRPQTALRSGWAPSGAHESLICTGDEGAEIACLASRAACSLPGGS
jgi:hypothetical protein